MQLFWKVLKIILGWIFRVRVGSYECQFQLRLGRDRRRHSVGCQATPPRLICLHPPSSPSQRNTKYYCSPSRIHKFLKIVVEFKTHEDRDTANFWSCFSFNKYQLLEHYAAITEWLQSSNCTKRPVLNYCTKRKKTNRKPVALS